MEHRTFFEQNSLFFSRLGFENDPPRLDDHGKLIEFRQDYDGFADLHRKIQQAGVRVHTSLLFTGWIGPDTYDYSLTDDTLKALFKAVPDALYLPRVKLNPPVEWQKEHPEELFVYWGENNDPEHIRPLVGTSEHDLLGNDAPNGYWLDKRPNKGGGFCNQSFSSDAWVRDAQKALVALMRHLAESPYADRIIGYHIGYGACGETCWWGRCSPHHGDYSRVFQQAFLDWGTRKYGSEEARNRFWGTTELPSPDQLIQANPVRLDTYLRQRPQDRICRDRDLYVSQRNADLAKTFCQTVKEENPDMVTGVFYGYIRECANANYTGWLALQDLLDSPHVDFLAAPCSYYRREEGESGGYIVPAESVNRSKVFMDELDIRTYLATAENATGIHVVSKECTGAVFCREAAKNLMSGSGFWWMDLGGTYYDSDFVRDEIRHVEALAARVRALPRTSTADILQLISEDSYWQHTESRALFNAYKCQDRELTLTGTLSETYRLKDLLTLDLRQYKLIILHDCISLTPEQLHCLQNFPGIILSSYLDAMGDCSFPARNPLNHIAFKESNAPIPTGDITFSGIFSGTANWTESTLPHVIPAQAGLNCYACFSDGSPALISTDQRHFHSLLPFMTWRQLRQLAELAGCATYGEAPCTAYGNSAFTAVFSHDRPQDFTFEIHDQR